MSLASLFTKFAVTGGAIAALASVAMPASAEPVYRNVVIDQHYINRESAEGRLSPWERRRLEERLQAIDNERRYDLYRDGGRLTPYQRERIDAQLRAERYATYRDARFHR
jgi:hypothetical protein